tara:strand:+ start:3048 stop:3632 length:585 start_codon:yes stop_codon:yes gene_type:complete
MARVSIVDFGKALQRQGWNIAEHSAFGGVTPGVHSPKGHHPHGEAIDITWKNNQYGDYDPTGKIGWQDYTQQLGEKLSGLKGANNNFIQTLHRGNDPKHSTHVHLGVTGGYLDLTPQQMQEFGIIDTNPTLKQASDNVLNVYFDQGSQHQDKKNKAKSLVQSMKESMMKDMLEQTFNPLGYLTNQTFDPYKALE